MQILVITQEGGGEGGGKGKAIIKRYTCTSKAFLASVNVHAIRIRAFRSLDGT